MSAPIPIGCLYDGVGSTNVLLVLVTALGEKASGSSPEQLEGTPA
ncbi:hypothetical protein [Streptomyces cylindrosporus]|nr:hypothetical protein [Streptomyces cylindrosporus]